jgi:hypothetical protein
LTIPRDGFARSRAGLLEAEAQEFAADVADLLLCTVSDEAPITAYVFGGVTGTGTDVVRAFFLATGRTILEAVLLDETGPVRDDRLYRYASMAWSPATERAYVREAAAFCRAVAGLSAKARLWCRADRGSQPNAAARSSPSLPRLR